MTALLTPDGSYCVFTLSIDELEWTRHWLGRLRCDQLLVYVARTEGLVPSVRIRAVESKSSSSAEPIAVGATVSPFDEGVDQVISTLDAVNDLLEPEGTNRLVEDLRFSTFVEHLASTALSDLHPLEASKKHDLQVLRAISRFSLKRPRDDIGLDGVVVLTQYRANVPRKAVRWTDQERGRDWPLTLIRAGSGDVDALIGHGTLASLVVEQAGPASFDPSVVEPQSDKTTEASVGGWEILDTALSREGEPVVASAASGTEDAEAGQLQLAHDLYRICRHRGFRVTAPTPDTLVVGPALVAVSMQLEAGSSIRHIEAATEDLAREMGVTSVSVENDPDRPYYVRFLIARRDRYFPPLPEQTAQLLDKESQSYLGLFLGKTLAGADFVSFVSSWPHLLVSGTTGAGKTTFLRSILLQIARVSPQLAQVAVVDGKGEVDYINVIDQEHLVAEFPEVLLGHSLAPAVLQWVVESEIPRRRAIVVDRARERSGNRPQTARDLFLGALETPSALSTPFPALMILIDEFAEIMQAGRGAAAQRFEQLVQQVTQTGRSSLVHLVLATQRPDTDVVRGAIKANLDARVALRLPTHHDSMTALGGKGAETLLGRGDLIFRSAGQRDVRLQGYSS